MDGKTTIAVEIRYYDGQIVEFQLSRNAWDLSGEDMGELFRQLMGAMGFAESTIASVFGDDQDLYAEALDEDYARSECCYDELPEDELPKSAEFHRTGSRSVDDPCKGCDEACDDTACLYANNSGPILDTDEDREEFFNKVRKMPRDWHHGDGDNE
jgi:hypothetical protein